MKFVYEGENGREISFPLGGIGAGCVGLSGNGRLIDWEIFNRPNKLSINEYTHFAIKAECKGKVLDARVLHGDVQKEFIGGNLSSHGSWGYGQGVHRASMAGLAHFRKVKFEGFYPIAKVTYEEEKFPGEVSLEAMNPFIPGNDKDSSMPCAFFDWHITNTSHEAIDYTIAFSCGNAFKEATRNRILKENHLTAIFMDNERYEKTDTCYGNMVIATDCEDTYEQAYWFRGDWFDDVTLFWREFSSVGKMKNRHYEESRPTGQDMSTLAACVKLQPGETKRIRFILAWYIPNVEKYWGDRSKVLPKWKNYYAGLFESSLAVARYCLENGERLWQQTRLFKDTLESSALPQTALDAIQANIAILKSSTCLRLENGEFWAWEGVNQNSGSCEGSCTHVWNYAYALPFLFPKLERSMRTLDYTYNTTPSGEMKFRLMLPLGEGQWGFRACVDGQLGGVMKFYRDWKISGDDEWLKKYWPEVKKSLEYAWSKENQDKWDPGQTGVIDGRQHHTLDMELFGPNAWLTGFYLGALKAGAEIAEYLGEMKEATLYRKLLEKGQHYVEKRLFNGKHYIQEIDLKDKSILDLYEGAGAYWNEETGELKYQIGEGCEIDQLVAQWHAHLIGLGDLFDKANRKQALKSIYKLNFKSMRETFNPCRVFCVDDEKGTLICEWDKESYKPMIPIPYTEEMMTGFEYAVATLMLQEGLEEEALELISAIRERYDGKKRNPWSEIECGSSYARAMASYGLLLSYSGFSYDMSQKFIGFNPIHLPKQGEKAKFFWSIEGAWGEVDFEENVMTLKVLYGTLSLKSVGVCRNKIAFDSLRILNEGESLVIQM